MASSAVKSKDVVKIDETDRPSGAGIKAEPGEPRLITSHLQRMSGKLVARVAAEISS